MGQQLSQVYSDSLKHSHSLIYSDCYETCAVALNLRRHKDAIEMVMCTMRLTIPELKIRQLLALNQKCGGGSNNNIRADLSLLLLYLGKQIDRNLVERIQFKVRSNRQ